MYTSYETQAHIRLHRQDLLAEAERDRLLSGPPRALPALIRRILSRMGRWLISLGARLEARYADASVSLAGTNGQYAGQR